MSLNYKNGKIVAIIDRNNDKRVLKYDCTTLTVLEYVKKIGAIPEEAHEVVREMIWSAKDKFGVVTVMKAPCETEIELQAKLKQFCEYAEVIRMFQGNLSRNSGTSIYPFENIFKSESFESSPK
jgi:hypothetical protein